MGTNKPLKIKDELVRHFSVLINGTPEEYKQAKKELKKLSNYNTDEFKNEAPFALEYIKKFDQIKTPQNQAAFISGLDPFFLTLSDDYFNELKDFVIKAIQHEDGRVREAIRKAADWLYMSLTHRIGPFVYPKGKELTQKQKDGQRLAKEQYINYRAEIERLIDLYNNEEEAEFIDQMNPSIEKSLQLLWEKITRSYRCAELVHDPSEEILQKRKEIEQELLELLKETDDDFGLHYIKDIIYNEDGADDLTDIIALFDKGQRYGEMENILETINDAWNYFPHRILDGLSPAEKLLEYKKETNK